MLQFTPSQRTQRPRCAPRQASRRLSFFPWSLPSASPLPCPLSSASPSPCIFSLRRSPPLPASPSPRGRSSPPLPCRALSPPPLPRRVFSLSASPSRRCLAGSSPQPCRISLLKVALSDFIIIFLGFNYSLVYGFVMMILWLGFSIF